jgi:hypothetical protein
MSINSIYPAAVQHFLLALVMLDRVSCSGFCDALHNEPLQVAPVGDPDERDRGTRRLCPSRQGSDRGGKKERRKVGRICLISYKVRVNITFSQFIVCKCFTTKFEEFHPFVRGLLVLVAFHGHCVLRTNKNLSNIIYKVYS